MISRTRLKNYAEHIYLTSDLCSEEEHIAEFILDLLSHAHNVESVLRKARAKRTWLYADGEDTASWDTVIQFIEGGN